MLKNKIYTFFILALYGLITVATSKADDPLTATNKKYTFTSNCSNASLLSGSIEVSTDGLIVNPSNIDFTNLGLPVANVSVGSDVSAQIAPALTRSCVYSSTTLSGVVTSTYTCADNSIPSCIINLVPN